MGRQTFLPVEILDYLETHKRSEEELFGISQQELAKNLGYHPCSMSRPLEELVRDGLVVTGRGLVRGGRRKQLTYRLTPAGVSYLAKETRDVPLLGRDIPPPPQPFLGRKEELSALYEAADGPSGVTLVEGPPGMGKTALVAVHLRRVHRGKILFWFTVRPSSSPREFASGMAHALSFAGNPQLAYYAQLPRNPVAREVADLAARTLGDHRLAAVIDDYQHAGEDLRSFLTEFIAALRTRGAHRFYLVGQAVDFTLGPEVPVGRLRVGGLDRAAAHELTDRRGGLADRFEDIYQTTLGSPLLLLLAASNPHLKASPAGLPVAVVRQLPIEDVRAILPAALANEALPASFISEASSASPERIQELVRMGILHQRGEDTVEVLEVVRNAVVTRVAVQDERSAHLALGRFYGRSHRPEAIRERFLHLVAGEDLPAASHLLSEQQAAILRFGYSDSLRRAFRHMASVLPHGPSRVRVLMVEAALLRHHSEHAESIRILRRAIAESEPRSPLAAESKFSIAEQLIRMGQVDEATLEFQAARRDAPVSRRLGTYARLTEARIEEARGHAAAALDLYQEAFDLSKKARAQDLGLEAIAAWSRLAEPTRGADVALRLVDGALPQARKANRMDIVFNLLLVRAKAYADTGRPEMAELEMNTIRSEAESLGYLNQLAYTLSGLSAVSIERLQWAEAETYARQAISMAERIGNDLVLGHTLGLLCTSGLRQAVEKQDTALVEEAYRNGRRSVEVLSRLAPSESLTAANAYLAEVCLVRGDPGEAKSYYDAAIALSDLMNTTRVKELLQAEIGAKLAQAMATGVTASTGA